MSTKAISSTDYSKTLCMSECKDGFWLHDTTRGMNLAMRAKSETEAFVDALEYYQDRLLTVEAEYKELKTKVTNFVEQFKEEEQWP